MPSKTPIFQHVLVAPVTTSDPFVSDPVIRRVDLKDDWVLTAVSPGESLFPKILYRRLIIRVSSGDIVNIIGTWNECQRNDAGETFATVVVSATENAIILHPDELVPVTSISSALDCLRRPVLTTLVRPTFGCVDGRLLGTFLHRAMQLSLTHGRWALASVTDHVHQVIEDGASEIDATGTDVTDLRIQMLRHASTIASFGSKFIASPLVSLSVHLHMIANQSLHRSGSSALPPKAVFPLRTLTASKKKFGLLRWALGVVWTRLLE